MTPTQRLPPIAVIGAGNMGKALIEGALAAGVLDPATTFVAEPDADRRRAIDALAVNTRASAREALELLPEGGQVLLAIKPQQLPQVVPELRAFFESGRRPVLISILAGTPTCKLRHLLHENARVVRAMPNVGVRLRRGSTAIALGDLTTDADAAPAIALFSAVGQVAMIHENLMDAFTAVAASGPAYVFYLAQAMIAAAENVGFNHETADQIVRQTIAGAAAMLSESSEAPHSLIAGVQSKGGTTEAAMNVLAREEVADAFIAAIAAARDRGRELST